MKFIMNPIRNLLAIMAALLVCASAYGQNSIEGVAVSPQPGGTVIVKVTMKSPLTNPPAGFTVNNPPRIAFDFPNTTNATGRTSQDIGEGDLRKLNVVQAGDRTRMVLELSRTATYLSLIHI